MRLFKRGLIWYYEIDRNTVRSLRTTNKREAESLFKLAKRTALKGRIVGLDESRITLAEYKKIFIRQHCRDIAGDTERAYLLALKLLGQSIGQTTLLSRIDTRKINKFKSDCLARKVKRVSINSYLRHIRGLLSKAKEWGYIKHMPSIPLYRLPQAPPRCLNDQERALILSASKALRIGLYEVIVFALHTGARRSEIARLNWRDVQGDRCRLTSKGRSRWVPLSKEAKEVMGEPKDIGYVFVHYSDLSKYSKLFKSVARSCGIPDIHFHNLRHTAATQMLRSGIDIMVVRDILGHASVTTTEIYVAVLKDLVVREMRKLKY